MKTLMLALSLCVATAFGQQCTGPVPARPATSSGCSDLRRACECDSTGSCQWAWSCLSLAKPSTTKAASPVSPNRPTAAPVTDSDSDQTQAVQNLKLRNQAGELSLLKPPVVAPASEESTSRLQKQPDQTSELIQLLQRIAVATESIARELQQPHK